MDLILWRHAEAEDGAEDQHDLERALTPRGEKQAARMAAWLDRHLPEGARILCSPARRCEQTALALGRKFKIRDALAPGGATDDLLEAAQWPHARHLVLVIGHQPTLGETAARLLRMEANGCAIRKGSAWWLRTRERDGQEQTLLWAVQSPETL